MQTIWLTKLIMVGYPSDGSPMKMVTGTVTVKGQVVIPALLRRRLGIKRGTLVSFLEENGHIVVQPVTREFIRRLRGSLKGGPSPLEQLIEERKRERVL